MREAKLFLEKQDIDLIGNCIKAIQELDIFPDWEFQTLFGFEKVEFTNSILNWPNVDLDDIAVSNSILGALNHLMGYPHKLDEELYQYTKASFQDMRNSIVTVKFRIEQIV